MIVYREGNRKPMLNRYTNIAVVHAFSQGQEREEHCAAMLSMLLDSYCLFIIEIRRS